MSYFDKIKVGDIVFGLVYGKGEVIYAINDKYMIQSFYSFEVEYANGQRVFYTPEGIPNWSNSNDFQTVFYEKDIHLCDLDIEPIEDILGVKKIIKYRDKKVLEMRCPSGVWVSVHKCPLNFAENALENGSFHLFRRSTE